MQKQTSFLSYHSYAVFHERKNMFFYFWPYIRSMGVQNCSLYGHWTTHKTHNLGQFIWHTHTHTQTSVRWYYFQIKSSCYTFFLLSFFAPKILCSHDIFRWMYEWCNCVCVFGILTKAHSNHSRRRRRRRQQ